MDPEGTAGGLCIRSYIKNSVYMVIKMNVCSPLVDAASPDLQKPQQHTG